MSNLTPEAAVVEEAAKIAEKFLGTLVNPALEEGGGILADTVKFWRFKNQVNLTLKAKDFLEKKGIEAAKILPKILIPIIENGSLEESDDMRNKWSAMLAHAADSSSTIKIRPGYPEILKQLSPLEVKILENFYDSIKNKPPEEQEKIGILKEKALQVFGIETREYEIIVDNLFRLGICRPPSTKGGMSVGDEPFALQTYNFINLTAMGIDFIKACAY